MMLNLRAGPIIGMAWTTQLTKHTTLIDKDDKILQFVMIMASGGMSLPLCHITAADQPANPPNEPAPTATSQIYLTAIFAPLDSDGAEMSALSA